MNRSPDIAHVAGLTKRRVVTARGTTRSGWSARTRSMSMTCGTPGPTPSASPAGSARRVASWQKAGSSICACHHPTPTPPTFATLVVLRCDAQRRLTVRWSWPGEPDSIVDLTLAPEGAGTRLVLEHLPLTDGLATEYGAGWEDFLAKLATTLAGGEHHGNDDVARTRLDLAQVGVSGPPNGHAAGWYAYELALAGHLGGMAHSEAEWQVDWERAMAILRD